MLLMAPLASADTCSTRITDISAAPETGAEGSPPTAGWVSVTLPDTWRARWPTADTVWYRIQWQDDCAGGQAIALAIESITMAGSVYVNDTLLWQDLSLREPFSRSWNMPRHWILPQAALSGTNVIQVRVTGMAQGTLGLGSVNIGDADSIRSLHQQRTWVQRHVFVLNLSISLVLGVLFFTLWLVRRSEQAFGWYALASLSWAVFAGTMLATTTWFLPSSHDWNRFVCTVLVVYCCAFCKFTWVFGEQTLPRLGKSLWITSVVCLAALWTLPDTWTALAWVVVIPAFALITFANCLQFQFHASHNRQRHNLLLAACLLLFLIIGLRDLLLVTGVIGGNMFYFPITSAIAMIFMFLIIADRFARSLKRIESFNEELRSAVDKSRNDLTQTLQREHALETRNIRLAERLRFSHDLHDSLGSSLMRSIATIEQSDKALDNTRFLSMLKELRGDLRQIIDNSSSHMTSDNCTPVEWIAPLRHRFVRLFDELGLVSNWNFPAAWPCRLSALQLLALTRFVEEALTNALKHSHGDTLTISLSEDGDNGLKLEVCDNGVGFDVDAIRAGYGVGMRSMQARIDRVDGRLEIHSQAGETRLVARLTCPPQGKLTGIRG